MKNVNFLYRDACNYKTYFTLQVDPEVYSEILDKVPGDEIIMGELGTPNERNFFRSEIHPHKYMMEHDHNILEIESIGDMVYSHMLDVAFVVENTSPDSFSNEEAIAGLKKRIQYLEEHPQDIQESIGIADTGLAE